MRRDAVFVLLKGITLSFVSTVLFAEEVLQAPKSFSPKIQIFGWVHERSPLEKPVLRAMSGLVLESRVSDTMLVSSNKVRTSLPVGESISDYILSLGGPDIQAWLCFDVCYERNFLLEKAKPKTTEIILADSVYKNHHKNQFVIQTTQEERDVLYHMARVRDLVRSVLRTSWTENPVNAMINSDEGTCNAHYSEGTLHFYQAGVLKRNGETYTCKSTGTIADIIYHEWTHGFTKSIRFFNEPEDDAADEAAGDIVAFHITNDSRIGLGLFEGRPLEKNFIHDVDTRDSKGRPVFYSEDHFKFHGNAHDESLVLSGAMWELRRQLMNKYGREGGNRLSLLLFLHALLLTQRTTEFYLALLKVDDNDKNLLNGTPHMKEISKAFGTRCIGGMANADYCKKKKS